jgi:hypothetical protein
LGGVRGEYRRPTPSPVETPYNLLEKLIPQNDFLFAGESGTPSMESKRTKLRRLNMVEVLSIQRI